MVNVNATGISGHFPREIYLDIENEIRDKIMELNDDKEFDSIEINVFVQLPPRSRCEQIYATYC